MFWIAIVIALVSGVVALGVTRESVKERWPRLGELHIDIVLLVLLLSGLVVATAEHWRTEKKVSELEVASNATHSFEVDIDVRVSSEWARAMPSSPLRKMIVPPQAVARAGIELASGEVEGLPLWLAEDPIVAPQKDGWVHSTFRVRAEPSSWVLGIDKRQLVAIRQLKYDLLGIRFSDSQSGVFSVDTKAVVFVNGREAAVVESGPGKVYPQLDFGDKDQYIVHDGNFPFDP